MQTKSSEEQTCPGCHTVQVFRPTEAALAADKADDASHELECPNCGYRSANLITLAEEAREVSQAPSEEDFVGLIKYINEREKGLSRYSDKLRQSLQRIFDVFGNPDYCQICGCNKQTGTNQEGENKGKHAGGAHAFVPKIRVSVNVRDEQEICPDMFLEFADGELRIADLSDCYQETDGNWYPSWLVPDNRSIYKHTYLASREELKTLVRSGRLPKFLALMAEKLRETEAEYGEVSELAERMAQAIEGQ